MNILRIMSFVDESAGKELVLPVTPAKYTWRHPNRIETVRLDQLGEINLPGGARMGECTLEDVLLPAQLYPFCVPGARAAPQSYLYDLETWSDKGSKLRWIVSGTSINVSVMIEEITQGERDGSNDLYLTISLRQWRRPDAPVLAVSGGGAETPRETGTGAASAKTYTVVKGDCLWNIAKQFYGSGAEYKRLAAANPSIKNPNLFDNVPAEGAAGIAASDFGIPTGRLDATGVMLRRKFTGVALDKIITTMYSLAGEQTGKRYLLRFSGSGAMEVIEKAEAASLEVAQTMGVTNTWNITDLCNSVAIYTKEGRLVRKVEDGGSQTLNGRLEHAITQQDKEDAGPEAQAWLTDHGLQQNLTVEVLDPPISLITGEAVILRDTGSGVSGLFWVDGDTHSWKNKIHTGKFKLNFRNMMNSGSAGQEL